ncbi:MAG: hypothetical protein JXQ83_14345 [Candidatus Glassbacteria bacterium]|nr:hypothetical protein [Candidatus Glassbacteria bacterium]
MPGRSNRIPLLLWPFAAVWHLLSFILKLTGRLAAAVLGLALMVAGLVLTLVILAAPVGIPLFILGLLVTIRGIF